MLKQLPSPSLLRMLMEPWCISINSFTSERPIPVLAWLKRFLSTKFSKRTNRDFCLFSAIPIPWSSTARITSFSSSCTITLICFPWGVYLKAFDNRLNNIFSNLSESAHILRLETFVSILKSIWCSSARLLKLSIMWRMKGIRSICCTLIFIFLFCILRKSRI